MSSNAEMHAISVKTKEEEKREMEKQQQEILTLIEVCRSLFNQKNSLQLCLQKVDL